MTEILFIGSILLLFYAYFGYPFSLFLINVLHNRGIKKVPFFPNATVIITSHNEEKRVGIKLQNTLDLDYPKDKLQIIVASDGSTDRTNQIVRNYHTRGIELLEISERKGKENSQKEALKLAKGDVIIFTDVATTLETHSLKQIVSNFADPSIGCVSSEDRLLEKNGKPCGEGFYVRYEMWLRRLESRVNSLVGLSGSFFAARREVCEDFSEEMQSDFRTVLNALKMGLRGVSDPKAVCEEKGDGKGGRRFKRKLFLAKELEGLILKRAKLAVLIKRLLRSYAVNFTHRHQRKGNGA